MTPRGPDYFSGASKEKYYLQASDVHGHQVLADLGPFHGARAGSCDVEDFGPQAADGNAVNISTGIVFFHPA